MLRPLLRIPTRPIVTWNLTAPIPAHIRIRTFAAPANPNPNAQKEPQSQAQTSAIEENEGHAGDWFEDTATGYEDSEPVLDMFRNAEMNATEPHPGALFEDTGGEDVTSPREGARDSTKG
ncbi:hypothetical protein HDV00_009395 [Rhizophlyctis rosea]|nr:hypothetical protein HDV00_009395 [Rhizophlyctis rosea]